MTYTVSHRQGGVQRSAVAGLIRHTFRDVDKSNGKETQHSNERIIPERTHLNESWMWVDGERVELTNSRQIVEELDSRLAKAGGTRTNKKTGKVSKIAVREDAKVVRDLVLQLDPQFTRSSAFLLDEGNEEHQQEVRRLLGEMIDHYAEVYGKKNLLAASLHLDETSPHVHLMVTPIDEDGRVRQESFIKAGRGSKSGMSDNDRAMRERLKTTGYDVDPKPRGANRSHMSIDEFAKWQERIEELAAREIEVEDAHAWVVKNRGTVKRNHAHLEKQRKAQEAQDARLRAREASVEAKGAEAAKMAQMAAQRLSVAKEWELKAVQAERFHQKMARSYGEAKAQALNYSERVKPLVKKWEQANPHTPVGQKAHKSAKTHAQLVAQIEARAAEIEANGRRDEGHQLG